MNKVMSVLKLDKWSSMYYNNVISIPLLIPCFFVFKELDQVFISYVDLLWIFIISFQRSVAFQAGVVLAVILVSVDNQRSLFSRHIPMFVLGDGSHITNNLFHGNQTGQESTFGLRDRITDGILTSSGGLLHQDSTHDHRLLII